jgi:hypothetical protein
MTAQQGGQPGEGMGIGGHCPPAPSSFAHASKDISQSSAQCCLHETLSLGLALTFLKTRSDRRRRLPSTSFRSSPSTGFDGIRKLIPTTVDRCPSKPLIDAVRKTVDVGRGMIMITPILPIALRQRPSHTIKGVRRPSASSVRLKI